MSAKIQKKLQESLKGLGLDDKLVKAIVETVEKSTSKKVKDVKEFIREYVKDTQKHTKGTKIQVSEKNIINQLGVKLDKKALDEVLKRLKNGEVIDEKITKNASKYYKAVK
jgi:hypothetical protein